MRALGGEVADPDKPVPADPILAELLVDKGASLDYVDEVMSEMYLYAIICCYMLLYAFICFYMPLYA
jgi:hypothetical protein